jgi:hypothetical protein
MTASVDRLGRRCSFVKGLFAKTRGLHKDIIPERNNGPGRLAIIVSSVADPGCLSRIPDPDFYPSRIPDPKTATKEKGEKKFVVISSFVATNLTKLQIISFLIC